MCTGDPGETKSTSQEQTLAQHQHPPLLPHSATALWYRTPRWWPLWRGEVKPCPSHRPPGAPLLPLPAPPASAFWGPHGHPLPPWPVLGPTPAATLPWTRPGRGEDVVLKWWRTWLWRTGARRSPPTTAPPWLPAHAAPAGPTLLFPLIFRSYGVRWDTGAAEFQSLRYLAPGRTSRQGHGHCVSVGQARRAGAVSRQAALLPPQAPPRLPAAEDEGLHPRHSGEAPATATGRSERSKEDQDGSAQLYRALFFDLHRTLLLL